MRLRQGKLGSAFRNASTPKMLAKLPHPIAGRGRVNHRLAVLTAALLVLLATAAWARVISTDFRACADRFSLGDGVGSFVDHFARFRGGGTAAGSRLSR